MEKVKKSTVWKNICLMISLLFALGALSMLFFEMVHNVQTGATYKGYDIAFCCIEGDQFLGNIA
ncbi:MAG: hypothetical protein IJX18_02335, partial [Clostridia bacterium]|nr:hypothetical protein [Clostridia bacterium]